MKELEKEKQWSGDGYGANFVMLRQVKRNERAAIYARHTEKGTRFDGYEVFEIKKRLKGQPLPGGGCEAEDREVYPSANSFGKSAKHVMDMKKAEFWFNEFTKKASEDTETEAVTFTIPVKEFTTGELAEANSITYNEAQAFLKSCLANNSIKFLRKERRNARGKESSIYSKV